MDIEVRQPQATGRDRAGSGGNGSDGGKRTKLIIAGAVLVVAGGIFAWTSGLFSGDSEPTITIEEAYAAPEETTDGQPQRRQQQFAPRMTGDN